MIPASADPVIAIDNEQLHPVPDPSLTGQLINQSGEVVNVAHVLGTFYNKSGQVVWVADQYVDRALLPQTPMPFKIHVPEDLARNISSERTVVASYRTGGQLVIRRAIALALFALAVPLGPCASRRSHGPIPGRRGQRLFHWHERQRHRHAVHRGPGAGDQTQCAVGRNRVHRCRIASQCRPILW